MRSHHNHNQQQQQQQQQQPTNMPNIPQKKNDGVAKTLNQDTKKQREEEKKKLRQVQNKNAAQKLEMQKKGVATIPDQGNIESLTWLMKEVKWFQKQVVQVKEEWDKFCAENEGKKVDDLQATIKELSTK